MRILIILLAVLYSNTTLAVECSAELDNRLAMLVKEDKLSKNNNTTNKHKKLTDHDYPIKCETSFHGIKYNIYTDDRKRCLIVQEFKKESGEYFGVFCI
jgi:hypothetical protein